MRKRGVDKVLSELEKNIEFKARGNKEYKAKIIIDSAMYSQQANGNDKMPGLYHFVLWKNYLEEENTWKPLSVVIHFQKLIGTYYKEYLEKLIVASLSFDFAPLMVRPSVPKKLKQSMATQIREPIKEAKLEYRIEETMMPFVASYMDIISQPLIQSLVSIFNQYSILFSVFLARFQRFFNLC